MPGPVRSAAEKARLEARAKAMREDGASMAEVERETGVPVSTLYQWAARGGWRGCDLAEAAVRRAMAETDAEMGPETDGETEPGAEPEPGDEGEAGGGRDDAQDGWDDDEAAAQDRAAGRPIVDELRAEADRCARAAMALSRAGRIREADAALRLSERYAELAVGEEARELTPLERVREELKLVLLERRKGAFEDTRKWVHAALCGQVEQLPGWATQKDFLADTLYPDMWYRSGGIGTGIAGHFGPGPADYLVENGGDGVRPDNLQAMWPGLVYGPGHDSG